MLLQKGPSRKRRGLVTVGNLHVCTLPFDLYPSQGSKYKWVLWSIDSNETIFFAAKSSFIFLRPIFVEEEKSWSSIVLLNRYFCWSWANRLKIDPKWQNNVWREKRNLWAGTNPMKLLRVKVTSEFYEFSKTNPMKHIFAIFFADITHNIQEKCFG